MIISVPLLLVPSTASRLSRSDCLDILTALFEFITRSGRRLMSENLYYYLKHCRSCNYFVLSSSSTSMVSDWIVVKLHYANAASHGVTLALPSA